MANFRLENRNFLVKSPEKIEIFRKFAWKNQISRKFAWKTSIYLCEIGDGPPFPGAAIPTGRHSQGQTLPGVAIPRGRHSQGAPLYSVSEHLDPRLHFP